MRASAAPMETSSSARRSAAPDPGSKKSRLAQPPPPAARDPRSDASSVAATNGSAASSVEQAQVDLARREATPPPTPPAAAMDLRRPLRSSSGGVEPKIRQVGFVTPDASPHPPPILRAASSPPSSAAPPSPTPPHPARRRRTTETNSTDMALLMDPGAEPLTEGEKADLDGIAAIKESAAREYKEQGNQFLKMGRKHYADAVDCYTKAIAQMEPLPVSAPDPDASVLIANRAHVNLLLGNHRRALDDAEQAVRLSPSNVKACYRAAKAALALNLLPEAASFCRRGFEQDPANEELKKLLAQVEAQQSEQDRQRAKVAQAITAAKDVAAAIEKRGLRLGKAAYQELTGVKKPKLDEQGMLHWPVLLLYPEVMSSDFIEDFLETDLFSSHLDVMFSESSPSLPWDEKHAYTRDAIELYYRADGALLSKSEILKYLLEGSVDSRSLPESLLDGEDGEHEIDKGSTVTSSEGSGKWIKVREGKTLLEALQHKDYIIPAIPVFFVVSRKSTFYSEFKAGNWSLP